MIKYTVQYEMEVSVKFHDQDKAMDYFKGEFKEGFWAINDIEDGVTSIANQFVYMRDTFAEEIFLEGFGGFSRVKDKRDVWENNEVSQEYLGKVTIELENDLEAMGVIEE